MYYRTRVWVELARTSWHGARRMAVGSTWALRAWAMHGRDQCTCSERWPWSLREYSIVRSIMLVNLKNIPFGKFFIVSAQVQVRVYVYMTM